MRAKRVERRSTSCEWKDFVHTVYIERFHLSFAFASASRFIRAYSTVESRSGEIARYCGGFTFPAFPAVSIRNTSEFVLLLKHVLQKTFHKRSLA